MSQRAENEITALRGEKDAYFRDDPDSPIPADKRANFKGLIYYSPDPTYRVKARLKSSLNSVGWVRRIIDQTFEVGALIRRDGRIRIISEVGIFLPAKCCNLVFGTLAHVDL